MEEKKRNKESGIKRGSVSTEKTRADHGKKPQPVKPVTVRLEDFKRNLNQVVAESQLPPFLTVTVLREMLLGMSNVAQMEYEQDLEAWKNECMEYEERLKAQERGHKEGEKDG